MTTTRESTRRSKKVGTTLGLVALALAVATAVVWFRLAQAVAIPEDRSIFVALFLLAPTLGIAAFVARTRWFGGLAAVAAIAIGGFLTFTIAISRQEVAPNGIRVGDTIPHFVALDDRGATWDSDALDGQRVLMKFFRGHW